MQPREVTSFLYNRICWRCTGAVSNSPVDLGARTSREEKRALEARPNRIESPSSSRMIRGRAQLCLRKGTLNTGFLVFLIVVFTLMCDIAGVVEAAPMGKLEGAGTAGDAYLKGKSVNDNKGGSRGADATQDVIQAGGKALHTTQIPAPKTFGRISPLGTLAQVALGPVADATACKGDNNFANSYWGYDNSAACAKCQWPGAASPDGKGRQCVKVSRVCACPADKNFNIGGVCCTPAGLEAKPGPHYAEFNFGQGMSYYNNGQSIPQKNYCDMHAGEYGCDNNGAPLNLGNARKEAPAYGCPPGKTWHNGGTFFQAHAGCW